jgi:hypothetical protein
MNLKRLLNNYKPPKTKTKMENQNEGVKNLPTTNLPFGAAIEALKQGKRVARKGWNGKGMFVFMQVPAEIPKDVVPKMQSLPQSVKDEFQRRFDAETHLWIRYSNQMAIVDQNNEIKGWSPSGSDSLAEDWVILD